MSNSPFVARNSTNAGKRDALSDLAIGSRWAPPQESGLVLTVLENRGPMWARTVLWTDQRGGQGVTALRRFTSLFARVPTEDELASARRAAAIREEERAIEKANRRKMLKLA